MFLLDFKIVFIITCYQDIYLLKIKINSHFGGFYVKKIFNSDFNLKIFMFDVAVYY